MFDGGLPSRKIVIATAASTDSFDALITLVASVHRQPDRDRRPILCLDLGLLPAQRSELERLEDVTVLQIPADVVIAHPHIADPKAFAWKVWLIDHLVEQGTPYLYLDAHRQEIRDHRGLRWLDQPGHARGPAVWSAEAPEVRANGRPRLRVTFRGFWPGFDPEQFFMVQRMRTICDVDIVDHGDVLFFGPFGGMHSDFPGLKVFVSAESEAIPRRHCDYSISSHFDDVAGHLRFPLVYWGFFEWPDDLLLLSPPPLDEWSNRPHFCNFIFSNATPTHRNEFFQALSRRRFVHAPGKVFTNSPPVLADGDDWKTPKRAYMQQFRFTVAFENALVDGYTTEKAMDALLTGTIPIYWGNDRVHEDLDRSRLIVANDFESLDALADFVCTLDGDPALAASYLRKAALSTEAVANATAQLDAHLASIVADALSPYRNPPRRAAPVAGAGSAHHPVDSAGPDHHATDGAEIVVASAADSAAFSDAMAMIDSLRRFDVGRHANVVVLDLGLAPEERSVLESRVHVTVMEIPEAVVREVPHLANVGALAWRMWLADHLVSTQRCFVYLDPDIRFVGDPSSLFAIVAENDVMLIDEPELTVGALLAPSARSAVGLASFERMAGAVSARVFAARSSEQSAVFFAHVLRLAARPEVFGGLDPRDRTDQAILSVLAARSGFDRQPKGRWESHRAPRPDTVLLLP